MRAVKGKRWNRLKWLTAKETVDVNWTQQMHFVMTGEKNDYVFPAPVYSTQLLFAITWKNISY